MRIPYHKISVASATILLYRFSVTDSTALTALREAIAKAGSQAALADKIGVTQQAVSSWVQAGRVPPWQAIVIETVVGTPRWRLCPERFTPPGEAAA